MDNNTKLDFECYHGLKLAHNVLGIAEGGGIEAGSSILRRSEPKRIFMR